MQEVFAGRLKQIRKERGLTQQQLSEDIDITIDHYVKVESGARNVSLPVFVRLCRVLQVSADYFLCEEKPASALSPEQRAYLQTVEFDELEALLQMLRLLYEKQQNAGE